MVDSTEKVINTESGLIGKSKNSLSITDETIKYDNHSIDRSSIINVRLTNKRPYDMYAIIGLLLNAITGILVAYRVSYSLSFIWSVNVFLGFLLLGLGLIKLMRTEPYQRIIIETNDEYYNIGLARQIDFVNAYELLGSHLDDNWEELKNKK